MHTNIVSELLWPAVSQFFLPSFSRAPSFILFQPNDNDCCSTPTNVINCLSFNSELLICYD